LNLPALHPLRKAWHSTVGPVALVSAIALAFLFLANPASAGNQKVVGVTLFNFQNPYVATVGDAMKARVSTPSG
jgi:hypothetical protein